MHQTNDQSFCRRAVLSCALITGMYAGTAQAQSIELRSDLLVDIDQTTLYAMHPEGGVQAINALDGSLRWRSNDLQRPILIEQGRLLGQGNAADLGNQFNLVFVDALSGVALSSASVELPEDVQVMVDDGLGTSFDASQVGGEFVSWQSEQRVIQGAFIEGNQLSSSVQNGALRVDVLAGSAEPVTLNDLPERQARVINAQATEQLASVVGRQFVSADRQYILASERSGDDPINPYQWNLFDTTGTRIGSIQANTSRSDFIVFNDTTMVYVSEPFDIREGDELVSHPLSLVAVDLTSGRILWERTIRDTRYIGPFPP